MDVDRNICFKQSDGSMTTGHNAALVKEQPRMDMKKYSFSERTVTDRTTLSDECTGVSV